MLYRESCLQVRTLSLESVRTLPKFQQVSTLLLTCCGRLQAENGPRGMLGLYYSRRWGYHLAKYVFSQKAITKEEGSFPVSLAGF